MDLKRFRKTPILGILRGVISSELEPLFETLVEGGLQAVEITMNTENASTLLKKAVQRFGKKIMIGAGTVLTSSDLQTALKAGATFIVSPVVVPSVVRYCKKHAIPVFPGALTPSEIYKAWQEGATMVKVFPASFFGPDYFKEIKGPFPQIELLACSGVTPVNAPDYFESGASAIAVGSSLFRKEWLRARKFPLIRKGLTAYLKALPRQ